MLIKFKAYNRINGMPTAHGRRAGALLINTLLTCALFVSAGCEGNTGSRPPNVIIILADDMGYADLGSYGSPTIATPTLDRLASEGQRWTNFYAAASVCSPSRASLLTGRYPIRTGVGPTHPLRRVFFTNSLGGLPQSEVTIAELLKEKGYATGMIGKWHLGHLPEHAPMTQGFDWYYGIPYSNDMDAVGGISVPWSVDLFFEEPNINYWDVPLMSNNDTLERPADQTDLTQRYTRKALDFIEANAGEPFFLYYAHNFPHTPLFASEGFRGRSAGGLYGDVMEEFDWSVAQIVTKLESLGIDDDTLLVFTSDNGPWLLMRHHGGSAGMLRDGKGTTWEGGMREPAIFWMPGTIEPKVVRGIGSTLDLMPTIAGFAGVELPDDRVIDGYDLSATLRSGAESPREEMIFYRLQDVYAVRKGSYKAHFITESAYGNSQRIEHPTPLLFNVDEDAAESFDIASDNPETLAGIVALVKRHKATLVPVENELDKFPPGQLRGEEGVGEARPWDADERADLEQ